MVFRSVYRRKTDLMPTIPSPRDGHYYGSRSSLSTTPARTPGKTHPADPPSPSTTHTNTHRSTNSHQNQLHRPATAHPHQSCDIHQSIQLVDFSFGLAHFRTKSFAPSFEPSQAPDLASVDTRDSLLLGREKVRKRRSTLFSRSAPSTHLKICSLHKQHTQHFVQRTPATPTHTPITCKHHFVAQLSTSLCAVFL